MGARIRFLAASVVAVLGLGAVTLGAPPIHQRITQRLGSARPQATVEDRLKAFGPAVRRRLEPLFISRGLSYPPAEVAYLAFKDAARLEVYARSSRAEPWCFIRAYPVLAASGKLGPKLAEGDLQVPEGSYQAAFLHANSRFHLSIRLNYPNAFDRKMARLDGRTSLGGDIMIHGNQVSTGCLAMGDEAAEDLFILAALAKGSRLPILVCPTDFRRTPQAQVPSSPPWVSDLYAELKKELAAFAPPIP